MNDTIDSLRARLAEAEQRYKFSTTHSYQQALDRAEAAEKEAARLSKRSDEDCEKIVGLEKRLAELGSDYVPELQYIRLQNQNESLKKRLTELTTMPGDESLEHALHRFLDFDFPEGYTDGEYGKVLARALTATRETLAAALRVTEAACIEGAGHLTARRAAEKRVAELEAREVEYLDVTHRLEEAIGLARTGIELALDKSPGLTFPDAEVETLMRYALNALPSQEAKPSAEHGPHRRVFDYDAALKCLDCGALWGALPGKPTMPTECKPRASESAPPK